MVRITGTRTDAPKVARLRDVLFFFLFLALWLVPMGYRGFSGRQVVPGMPVALSYLQNASCLFSRNVESWHEYYVLGWDGGERGWFELSDSVYSPMQPFGYKSRMDFIIGEQSHSRFRNLRAQRQALALWYRDRYAALNPKKGPLLSFKIVRVRYPIGTFPTGFEKRWGTPAFSDVPRDLVADVYHYQFNK